MRHQSTTKSQKRPTIGFISVGGGSNWAIEERWWPDIEKTTSELGANLVTLYLSESNREKMETPLELLGLTDPINAKRYDGFMGYDPAVIAMEKGWELGEFFKRYCKAPSVMIAGNSYVPPYIKYNIYPAGCALVEHLITRHGRRKIAVVNRASFHINKQLEMAYRDTLAKHGIPFSPSLTMDVNGFNDENAIEAITTLLDHHGQHFDAILFPIYKMAHVGIQALEKRGIHVPGDVSVAIVSGNFPPCRYMSPLLTQIREYSSDFACHVTGSLVRHAKEEMPLPPEFCLDYKLAIHESCGCYAGPDFNAMPAGMAIKTTEEKQAASAEMMTAEIAADMDMDLGPRDHERINEFVQVFLNDVKKGTHSLLQLIGTGLPRWGSYWLELEDLYVKTIRILVSGLKQYFSDPDTLLFAYALLQNAETSLEHHLSQNQQRVKFNYQDSLTWISEFAKKLAFTNNREELFAAIKAGLMESYHVEFFGLSLYETSNRTLMKICVGFNKKSPFRLEEISGAYAASRIIPDGFLNSDERYSVFVMPLMVEGNSIGLTFMGASSENMRVCQAIHDQISESYHRCLLSERQLHMQEKLRESNEALEQFAYVASHDLQEPLRKVQTFVEKIESHYNNALDEKISDYFARLKNASVRMKNLIDNLLAYSRVAIREHDLSDVDLNITVRDVMSDLEGSIAGARANVEPRSLPVIRGDALQMHQLFQNLISNGIKYRRQGIPPKVSITGKIELDPTSKKEMAVITFADNGIGFKQEYSHRIFQIFQRLHGRLEYEGTGIGLAICKKIVERHRGSLSAKSTPGAGATFIIRLPLQQL